MSYLPQQAPGGGVLSGYEYNAREAANKRRQAIAQRLMGAQLPQGTQFAGNMAVKQGPLEFLAPLLSQGLGMHADKKAAAEEQAIASERNAELAKWLGATQSGAPMDKNQKLGWALQGQQLGPVGQQVGSRALENELFPAKEEAYTLKPGEARMQGNQVLAERAPINNAAKQPTSVQEYEYAKQNGYKGSFQDWTVAGGQSSRPSSVQEWEFFSKLPDDQKRVYLEMKRNPNMQVKDIGQVPTVVAPSNLGTQTQALSSLPQEAAAASQIESAKKSGQLEGQARTEAKLDLPKAEDQAAYMESLLTKLETHPGLSAAVGVKGITNYLPATDAADFNALKEQVGGRQFLEAFNSLKGGGQITEVEGQKAEVAIARMQTAQSEKSFKQAVGEFKAIVSQALQRSRTRAGVADGQVRSFATEAEAEAAGIKPGTRVIIGGVPGTWQ